ncbi:MAG: N-acetylglucosamine-6-phosphate deacetylase [Planctomycetota bacterium]
MPTSDSAISGQAADGDGADRGAPRAGRRVDPRIRVLRNASAVLPARTVSADVIVQSGRIQALCPAGTGTGDEVWDLAGREVGPALIDTHTHGGWGVDFATASADEMLGVAERYARAGVARLLPTLYPGPEDWLLDRLSELARVCERSPAFVGIHLEGPFIAPDRRGALPEAGILPFDSERFGRILAAASGWLRVMTFAPEAIPFDRYRAIQSRGVALSIGHTSCTAEVARAAVAAGAHRATHLCNAMPVMHHRAPGPVAPLLLDPRVRVEVIVDGVHVADPILQLVLAIKASDRVLAVSDSMAFTGVGPTAGLFAGHAVTSDGERVIDARGTLAGSVTALLPALERTASTLGLSRSRMFQLGATAPAVDLPHSHPGRVATGAPADLVIFDRDGSLLATLRAGERADDETARDWLPVPRLD